MRRWLSILLFTGFALAFSNPTLGQSSLEAAKAAGLVGERADGLVGFVADRVDADLRSAIDRVNAQRMQRYRDVARRNGTSVEQVQAVAGAELIARTPSGQYVMGENGRWTRK